MDANVLLRFLTGKPPEMADRAGRLIGRAALGEASLRIHPIVVAETVWVLESFYEYSKSEISGALLPLLSDHGLKIEERKAVLGALELMTQSSVDFADALLAETAVSRGESIVSFDRDFRRLGVGWTEPR
ncbi:MAG: PIN domain-containing protein [Rubrobacteraceae bacterium]